jgi:tetratricopeptide (TPR) repeat protein
MSAIATALNTAAGTLQSIAESTSGERARRAGVVAQVLRTVDARLAGSDPDGFSLRRARAELQGLPGGAERSLLRRLVTLAEEGGSEAAARLPEALVRYGCELEQSRRLEESAAVLELARSLEPESAEVALHCARVARLSGRREEALELYRQARSLSGTGTIARFATIGEAVVSRDGERRLSQVIRGAILRREEEVAAVALEERALLRRERGAREGAARDLCLAAWRYADPVDRARVAHRLADLFVAAGDPLAAREALRLVLVVGDRTQQAHARSRLHTVSRDLGDQVGQRRWRSFDRPSLVSLSSRPRGSGGSSAVGRVAEWREAIEQSMAAPA